VRQSRFGESTKIHADSSLVDTNASLNSVRELDAATLDQIRQARREQTEKLDETEANKDQKDDDQQNFFLVDEPARSMRIGAGKVWGERTASSVSISVKT
jgi:hypothetical protein